MPRQFGHILRVRLDDPLYEQLTFFADRLGMRTAEGNVNVSGAVRVLLVNALSDQGALDLSTQLWSEARSEFQQRLAGAQQRLVAAFAAELKDSR